MASSTRKQGGSRDGSPSGSAGVPAAGSGGGRGRERSRGRSDANSAAVENFSEKLNEFLQHVTHEDATRRQEVLAELRSRLNNIITTTVRQTSEAITGQLDTCLHRLHAQVNETVHDGGDALVRKPRFFFQEKVFLARQSILTEMLAKPDFQAIYHIFAAVLVWMGVNIMLEEWFAHGRLVNFEALVWAFSHYDVVIPTWVCMEVWSTLIVPFVLFVDHYRPPAKLWMTMYALFQLVMLVVPSVVAVRFELPPASGFIVMCEMARFFMKSHAYLREKLLFGLRERPSSASPQAAGAPPQRVYAEYAEFVPGNLARRGMTPADIHIPDVDIRDASTELGRFFYFQFAPTLVYRDVYPSSGPAIDWVKALVHFFNLMGVILYTYLIFESFCVPSFKDTSVNPGDLRTFVRSVMRAMLPSMAVFFLMFFGVLHSWFNLWAQLLRFADCQFYEAWWTSTSFGSYYRRWNAVVHDWLYHYLYLDAARFSKGTITRGGGMAIVFLVSAIMHEQIIACAMRFFYPVLLLMFGGPGVFFVSLTKSNTRFFNIFMWCMLSVGNGLLLVLYSREYYARMGKHPVKVDGMDQGLWNLVPRSWLVFSHPSSGYTVA